MERRQAAVLMPCDVHRNPDRAQDYAPFLLHVQTDLLAELDMRVVVPLVRASSFGRRASQLHPEFTIDKERMLMATHLVAAIGAGHVSRITRRTARHCDR
jgi:toxin CcdB